MAKNCYPPDAMIVLLDTDNPHKNTTINFKQFNILREIPEAKRTIKKAFAEGVILNYLSYMVARQRIKLTGEGLPDEPEAKSKASTPLPNSLSPRPPKAGQRQEDRVYAFDDPEKSGVILKQGQTQSEVKFDNGNVRVVDNSWIKFAENGEFVPSPPITRKEEPNVATKPVRKKRKTRSS